jgi:hypothetical protein
MRILQACRITIYWHQSQRRGGKRLYFKRLEFSIPGVYKDMLTLSRENSLLALLPCAYLRASKYTTASYKYSKFCVQVNLIRYLRQTRILDGITRDDGTTATLSAMDQRPCLLGSEKVMHAQCEENNTFGWLLEWDPNENDCLNHAACTEWRVGILMQFLTTSAKVAFMTPAVGVGVLCASCAPHVQALVSAGRAHMWESLPSFFGLPPWSELKNEPW